MSAAVPGSRVTIRRVLCPVDRSETSRRALCHARALADWYAAHLSVIEVIWAGLPPVSLPAAVTSDFERSFLTPEERAQLETELRTFCTAAGEPASTDAQIVEGAVVPSILRTAAALPADVIVLGTHGLSGFDKLLLGSVTDKVLRKARCPVLTIPPSARLLTGQDRYRTIVCAVDAAPAARHAVDYALSLAQEAQASLLLVHVVEWLWPEGDVTEIAAATEFSRVRTEAATRLLDHLIPADARAWCHPETIVAYGRAHEEITRIANERSADLIVLGAHGRSPLTLAVFGSTTNQVIRHAPCPVLTVRA